MLSTIWSATATPFRVMIERDSSRLKNALVALFFLMFAAAPSTAVAAERWHKLKTVPYSLNIKQDAISFVDAKTGWYGNGTCVSNPRRRRPLAAILDSIRYLCSRPRIHRQQNRILGQCRARILSRRHGRRAALRHP